ncbi:MAG: ABC transporter substrate-binding protein [Burkholderiales bacterium]|nr:ABC transporter substrate-binding protein [Burkholderiales bacterium]
MPPFPHPGRRRVLQALASLPMALAAPSWAQPAKSGSGSRAVTVAQIVDTSTGQIDVTKDFLVGARTAWQEINSRGGLGGASVRHLVIEVNGSEASLRGAVESLKAAPHCVALFGSAGDQTAAQLVGMLAREIPDLPHVAPWLQNVEAVSAPSTFPIFASRQEQIAHAIKSLSVIGISQVGAVYGSAAEYASYRGDLEQIARSLKLSITSYRTDGDLRDLARSLTPDSPRVLLFVGGTPELVRFSQGVEKQAAQRYIVAMSDVNLQSIQQMGMSRFTPMIATQVVPMVNTSLPVVKAFRGALSRLYDEPPTPLSLAGYIAARYTHEVLQGVDGPITRANALQAFARRSAVDLGGFRITPDSRGRGTAYVTQSMVAADGRLVG